jgi:hypothetical protein
VFPHPFCLPNGDVHTKSLHEHFFAYKCYTRLHLRPTGLLDYSNCNKELINAIKQNAPEDVLITEFYGDPEPRFQLHYGATQQIETGEKEASSVHHPCPLMENCFYI